MSAIVRSPAVPIRQRRRRYIHVGLRRLLAAFPAPNGAHTMLKTHVDAVEGSLLATSQIAANTGHSLHKGTPRESFIKEFLEGHLSERVAIGTGEIIDAKSPPNPPATAQRPQFDIVLYKRDYPKLNIGGGISAFLAESVVATI